MTRIVRYSPERPFELARQWFEQMLDEPRWFSRWEPISLAPLDMFRPWGEWFPGDNLAIDLYEEDDQLIVQAALPGVRQEDVEVEERDGILTIRAKREADEARQGHGWYVRERRYGTWQRSVRLPMSVNVERAEAVLKDGVLSVSLPKADPHKKLVHRIKVTLPKIKLSLPWKKEGRIKVSHN